MPNLQDAAIQAAETIQTAHINKQPSAQDLAPSTAADKKKLVQIDETVDLDDVSDVGEDEIPVSLLRPTPRRPAMPPLPDLRFEQSYLASIKDANGWQGVAFITLRDQLLMPLVQGLAWTLIISGWRHWNSSTKFTGRTVGAKIRRWWWGVNNWTIPDDTKASLKDQKLADEVGDYVKTQVSTAGPGDG